MRNKFEKYYWVLQHRTKWSKSDLLKIIMKAQARVVLKVLEAQLRSPHLKWLETSTIWCWPIGY